MAKRSLFQSSVAVLAVVTLASSGFAQKHPQNPAPKDDFQREGNPEQRKLKDALEGRPAPALQVTDWKNIEGESLRLADLRGKVVVLDFWGVW